jgi:hypothetical protein
MVNGAPGIFCFEGDWSSSVKSRQSVEPVLELLQNCGAATYIHRDVATKEEFSHYLNRWLKLGKTSFPVAYLGFHGSQKTLHLSQQTALTLDDLAELLDTRARGRVLYFGSCSTLATSDEQLTDFCAATEVRGIVGYTRAVPFLDSVGFEVYLLRELLHMKNLRSIHKKLSKSHPVLTKELGLRIAHATWASDRELAVAATKRPKSS